MPSTSTCQLIPLRPLSDRLVVRPDEPEKKTPGGIVLPENAKDLPTRGAVIAVGPGRVADATGKVIPMSVCVGDRVIYGRYGGSDIELGDETVKVLRESDVLAVVEAAR